MSKKKTTDRVRIAFGQRVRALRKSADISQMELGERAGIDHTYIGGIERGERNLSIEAIAKVAKGLGVEIVELFHFSTKKLTVTNPHLADLVALLEQRDATDTKRALELVQAVLEWKDVR